MNHKFQIGDIIQSIYKDEFYDVYLLLIEDICVYSNNYYFRILNTNVTADDPIHSIDRYYELAA